MVEVEQDVAEIEVDEHGERVFRGGVKWNS